jgi:hypothetical protein
MKRPSGESAVSSVRNSDSNCACSAPNFAGVEVESESKTHDIVSADFPLDETLALSGAENGESIHIHHIIARFEADDVDHTRNRAVVIAEAVTGAKRHGGLESGRIAGLYRLSHGEL